MKTNIFLIIILFVVSGAQAQVNSKVLNIQGYLKSTGGSAANGTFGMRFTFKKNGAAFATACQITKNSVSVISGVFNAAVDTSACNLANEIANTTAAAITVDIEVDFSGSAFATAMSTYSGLPVYPVAMAFSAERANNILLSATNGQVLVSNGTSWSAGTVGTLGITDGSITSTKFAAGAVDTAALGAGSVTSAKIAAGAISSTGLAASSVNLAGTAVTGLLPIANGGTGASTAGAALSAIGGAANGANSDITSLTGLTTALSVSQGGTGATSASAARTSLSAAASGANTDITALTPGSALNIAPTGANAITIGGGTTTGTITIGGSSGAQAVNIGGSSSGAITIGGTSTGATTLGSTTGAASTVIRAGSGKIKIGNSGTALTQVNTGSATGLNLSATAVQAVTVTGATTTSSVSCSPVYGTPTTTNYWMITANVTAANTVSVIAVRTGTPSNITAIYCKVIVP